MNFQSVAVLSPIPEVFGQQIEAPDGVFLYSGNWQCYNFLLETVKVLNRKDLEYLPLP